MLSVVISFVLCAQTETVSAVRPFLREDVWGEWVGGGSTGYLYNSYRSNFEKCRSGHACVGECFRGNCLLRGMGKGRHARGMFCQSVGDAYETVVGKSALYNSMASCADGDYIVGMQKGNFTIFPSFRVICARGEPHLFADHTQSVHVSSFCPHNYVAISRCYQTSENCCQDGSLRCAPLVRSNFSKSERQTLHKVVGTPPNAPTLSSDVTNVHPLSVRLHTPQAISPGVLQSGAHFITVVNGSNKIVRVPLLSLERDPSNFQYHEKISRVESKSNFTTIATSPEHFYLGSTTGGNVTRIYRTDHNGNMLIHVFGGEVGSDLKRKSLCKISFLKYAVDSSTLYIGQPYGYVKWNVDTEQITVVGSEVCVPQRERKWRPLDSPLCIAFRRNQTIVVEKSGKILQEVAGSLTAFRQHARQGAMEENLKDCTYDSERDVIYMATKRCIFGSSLRSDFPEDFHVAGSCGYHIPNQTNGDTFRNVCSIEMHEDQLLIADQEAEAIYCIEKTLERAIQGANYDKEFEISKNLGETTVARLQMFAEESEDSGESPIALKNMRDIRQAIQGHVLIATKNNLQFFDVSGGKLKHIPFKKRFSYKGYHISKAFKDIYIAAVRDEIVFFADRLREGIFYLDTISGTIELFHEGCVKGSSIEDMVLTDDNELCLIANRHGTVFVHCIDTTTRTVHIIYSNISRYLPKSSKYSIAYAHGTLFLASGSAVVQIPRKSVDRTPAIVVMLQCLVEKMTVDAGTGSVLLLTDQNTILRVSCEDTGVPRLSALLTVSNPRILTRHCDPITPWQTVQLERKLLAISCHDKSNTILFIDSDSLYQADTHEDVSEYIPEGGSEARKHPSRSHHDPNASASSLAEVNNGSVYFEGDSKISIFQLQDDGVRIRPVIDVVIHGDSWSIHRISESPKDFIASILPPPVFSPSIIETSSATYIDSHKIRIAIGYDKDLKVPREYQEIALTSNFPDRVTVSGRRPYFLHSASTPKLKIDHGSKAFRLLKYAFTVLAGISLINSNPVAHVFIALVQASFMHPVLRCLTKPSIQVMSPLYNLVLQVDALPMPMARIISNVAWAIVFFPALYFFWANINKAADTTQHVFHETLLRHATFCIMMTTHTSISHAAYIGFLSKPTLYWIVYSLALVWGLAFIAYGAYWLRTAEFQWRVNPLLRDPITPSGMWYPIEKLRFHGIYFFGFRDSFDHSNLIVMSYYQLILLCSSINSASLWVYRTCTGLNVLVTASLGIFYVFFMPMRWRILNLIRGTTLNAICAFLLMDSSGSSEITTSLLAVVVVFLCATEGLVEIFTVWKESTIWHKVIGQPIPESPNAKLVSKTV